MIEDKKVQMAMERVRDIIETTGRTLKQEGGIGKEKVEALELVLSIAEGTTCKKVSEIEGFPKKKEPVPCVICNNQGCLDCFSDIDRAYNQAREVIGNLSLTLPKEELDKNKMMKVIKENVPRYIRLRKDEMPVGFVYPIPPLNDIRFEDLAKALCQAYSEGRLKKE